MMEVTISRSQAYQTVLAFLAKYMAELRNAEFSEVLSETAPVWLEGPGDPGIPGDWQMLAAQLCSADTALNEPMLPASSWLLALHPFLDAIWTITDEMPLSIVVDWLAQPEAPLPWGETPWDLWCAVTDSLVLEDAGTS